MNFIVEVVVGNQDFTVLDQSVGLHHIPVLHLNTNWFEFSCSTEIIEMRYTWFIYTSDFL